MSIKILNSFIQVAKTFNLELTINNLNKFKNLQKGEYIKNKCVGGITTK